MFAKSKLLVLLIIVLFLSGIPAARAVGENGAETVGTIPYLLAAVGEKNSTSEECPLGNVVADAARIYLKADIAIVCGGDLVGNLSPGEVTWDDIDGIFAEDRVLATASVTIMELRRLLESGLSYITLDETERIDEIKSSFGGFPQISGFILHYDASALPGERVREIQIGGESLDLDDMTRRLTLSSTKYMLEGGYGFPVTENMVESDLLLSTVTARYIGDGMPEYSRTARRIYVRGVFDGVLSDHIPVLILPIITLVFLAAYFSKSRRQANAKDRNNTPWYN